MRYLLILSVMLLSGCLEDRYRYFCQSPDNFHAEQCPEYLVAPILEKKVNDVQPEAKPNN